jgi:hypothetical protein
MATLPQPQVNTGFGHNLGLDLELESNDAHNFPQIKKYRIRLNLTEENDKGFEDCVICYDNVSYMNLVKLNCNHEFCESCIKNTLKHNNNYNNPSCALCRKTMSCFNVKNIEIYNSIADHCIL